MLGVATGGGGRAVSLLIVALLRGAETACTIGPDADQCFECAPTPTGPDCGSCNWFPDARTCGILDEESGMCYDAPVGSCVLGLSRGMCAGGLPCSPPAVFSRCSPLPCRWAECCDKYLARGCAKCNPLDELVPPIGGFCIPSTCSDGRANGDENGVDCGGSCPAFCFGTPAPGTGGSGTSGGGGSGTGGSGTGVGGGSGGTGDGTGGTGDDSGGGTGGDGDGGGTDTGQGDGGDWPGGAAAGSAPLRCADIGVDAASKKSSLCLSIVFSSEHILSADVLAHRWLFSSELLANETTAAMSRHIPSQHRVFDPPFAPLAFPHAAVRPCPDAGSSVRKENCTSLRPITYAPEAVNPVYDTEISMSVLEAPEGLGTAAASFVTACERELWLRSYQEWGRTLVSRLCRPTHVDGEEVLLLRSTVDVETDTDLLEEFCWTGLWCNSAPFLLAIEARLVAALSWVLGDCISVSVSSSSLSGLLGLTRVSYAALHLVANDAGYRVTLASTLLSNDVAPWRFTGGYVDVRAAPGITLPESWIPATGHGPAAVQAYTAASCGLPVYGCIALRGWNTSVAGQIHVPVSPLGDVGTSPSWNPVASVSVGVLAVLDSAAAYSADKAEFDPVFQAEVVQSIASNLAENMNPSSGARAPTVGEVLFEGADATSDGAILRVSFSVLHAKSSLNAVKGAFHAAAVSYDTRDVTLPSKNPVKIYSSACSFNKEMTSVATDSDSGYSHTITLFISIFSLALICAIGGFIWRRYARARQRKEEAGMADTDKTGEEGQEGGPNWAQREELVSRFGHMPDHALPPVALVETRKLVPMHETVVPSRTYETFVSCPAEAIVPPTLATVPYRNPLAAPPPPSPVPGSP